MPALCQFWLGCQQHRLQMIAGATRNTMRKEPVLWPLPQTIIQPGDPLLILPAHNNAPTSAHRLFEQDRKRLGQRTPCQMVKIDSPHECA